MFSLFESKRKSPPAKRPLRLEALETRWCPAVSVTATPGELRIVGDDASNLVSVSFQDGKFVVNENTNNGEIHKHVLPKYFISRVTVELRGGDDYFHNHT